MIEGRNPITPQELRHIAQGIHIGDTIEWRVPDASFDREKGSSRRRRLKVVRKSRHLLEAEDKNGRVHSIRYAEIAMKNREDNGRVDEMLKASRRMGKLRKGDVL